MGFAAWAGVAVIGIAILALIVGAVWLLKKRRTITNKRAQPKPMAGNSQIRAN